MESCTAILLAGGSGQRFGSALPKQFLPLQGMPIALHSYTLFKKIPWISEIVVVTAPSYGSYFDTSLRASPGERRQDSLLNGLRLARSEWILIHDSARPLISFEDLENLKTGAIETGAAALATPVKMTIKRATRELLVEETLMRDSLFEIQTPQLIRADLLKKGFEHSAKNGSTVTDDVSLIEALGLPVKLVLGSPSNIKITTPEDLSLVESLLCPAIN